MTTIATTPNAPPTAPLTQLRLSHAARRALTTQPHHADYMRNLLRGLGPRLVPIPTLKRLVCTDLFQAAFPDLQGPSNDLHVRTLMRDYRIAASGQAPRVPRDIVSRNIDELVRLLGLSKIEGSIIRLFLDADRHCEVAEFLSVFPSAAGGDSSAIVARALGTSVAETRRALSPNCALVSSGVLRHDPSNSFPSNYEVSDAYRELLSGPRLTVAKLTDRLFGTRQAVQLDAAAFAHLPAWPLAVRLVRAAIQGQTPGINVLLHGPPGTGKTEFARTLADAVKARLLEVSATDANGNSASTTERLAGLRSGMRLRLASSVMLFDELEDVVGGLESTTSRNRHWFSKAHLNDLLEKTPVPVIWTTNSVDAVDKAFLRRFTLSVEFKPAGPVQRERVLRQRLGQKHSLKAADIEAAAQRYDVSFAQLASAVSSAQMMGQGGAVERETLEALLTASQRLVTGKDPRFQAVFEPARFRLDAVSSDADVEALARAAEAWRPELGAAFTLCFYGPPGTGKSELAQYLAHRMHRRCLVKRASDILDMYVGNSEKNIARAFEEAQSEDAVLVFDEVDSLLRDRRFARQSWEVTQVNEFLQQLDAYRGAVICTTNLWKDLDQAALRRFAFKVEFRCLKPQQAALLFQAHFGELLPAAPEGLEARLAQVGKLTAGDFAAVSRRARVVGDLVTVDGLVAELEREVRARGTTAVVGFAQ